MGGKQNSKQNKGKLKQLEALTCSSADTAAAAEEDAKTGAEASAFLFFVSILVKAFSAAAGGLGAFNDFSFATSGPELTDGADPDFAFFGGGASSSPSSSLKHKGYIINGI